MLLQTKRTGTSLLFGWEGLTPKLFSANVFESLHRQSVHNYLLTFSFLSSRWKHFELLFYEIELHKLNLISGGVHLLESEQLHGKILQMCFHLTLLFC